MSDRNFRGKGISVGRCEGHVRVVGQLRESGEPRDQDFRGAVIEEVNLLGDISIRPGGNFRICQRDAWGDARGAGVNSIDGREFCI